MARKRKKCRLDAGVESGLKPTRQLSYLPALSPPLVLARDAPHAVAAHLKFNSWVQISATGCSCLWPSYPLTMRPTHASLAAVTPAHCCQSMYEHLDVWTDRRLAFSPGVSANTQIRCLHLAPSPLVISESSDLGCND